MRRTVLSWFMGITENQKILNIKKTETKINLTDAYRAMLSGLISLSGLANIFGNIPYAFSVTLPVMNLRFISDILIDRFR